ncbi:hypothetical protein QP248_02610 [Aerococcus sp. UMB8608]|uniref:hypothetical protein n=1 Tax=Aerococcus sp. UMB8608 TaxID=3046347 RepID=UPI00254F4649|nr:hypothetical protein [Aerococcus sp. UMB8608]MDK6679341.1 hypothetical protein [Aerococcus sp. UMB8608]
MADKMMRIAGRRDDGSAKAISVNDLGELRVESNHKNLMTEVVSNRDVPKGKTLSLGVFETIGMDTLRISVSVSNAAGYELTVEELQYPNESSPIARTTKIFNKSTGGYVFSGPNTVEISLSSSAIVLKAKNISNSMDTRMGFFVTALKSGSNSTEMMALNTARDKAEILKTDKNGRLLVNSNFNVIANFTAEDEKNSLAPSASFETSKMSMNGCNVLDLSLFSNLYYGYKAEIREYNYNFEAETFVLTKTHKIKNPEESLSYNTENKKIKIVSPYVSLYLKSLSSNLNKIGVEMMGSVHNVSSNKLGQIETMLEQLLEIQKNSQLNPKRAMLTDVKLRKTSVNYIHEYRNGKFYGTYGLDVYTSEDGEAWEKITSLPPKDGANRIIEHLFVGGYGNLVACCYGGEVFISDENGVFKAEPDIVSGIFNHNWGSTRHENVIAFTTYEKAGMETSNRHEAFLSTDSGRTFKRIFDKSIIISPEFPPLEDRRTHLHDIEYDPLSGRLYIWAGDFGAASLYYSDDWGNTWNMFANQRKFAGNYTQLISGPRGLFLAADTSGGGGDFLNIDRNRVINPQLELSDFTEGFWSMQDRSKRYLSTKKFVNRAEQIYMFSACPEYDENGRCGYLAFSRDGYSWQLLWESPHTKHMSGLDTVVYGNGRIVGSYNNKEGDGYLTFTALLHL